MKFPPFSLANGSKLLKRLFVNCDAGGVLSQWQCHIYFIHYAYRRWELINSDSVPGSVLNPSQPSVASIIQAARDGRREMADGKMASQPLKYRYPPGKLPCVCGCVLVCVCGSSAWLANSLKAQKLWITARRWHSSKFISNVKKKVLR